MILIFPMALEYLAGVYGGYDSAQVTAETAMSFTAVDPATGARLKDYPAWGGAELNRPSPKPPRTRDGLME
jgi:hypothetical protein